MENHEKNPGSPSWLRIVLFGRRPKYTFMRLVVLVLGTLVIFPFVLLPIRVKGISMQPTYRDGSVNFVNRLAYFWHEPRRGDVVSIRFSAVDVMLMKRVVGLPGETIMFSRGQLYVNDQPLSEPYVKYFYLWNSTPEKLGPDEYFVVGDNRMMRINDHEHGKAERRRIVGKVLL